MDRNVAILMTAPGVAAIAVIRIKGPGVPGFLTNHFSRRPGLLRCVHGEIREGDRILDDAVVVLMDEHTADLNVHGGTWVVRSILELARRAGFDVLERLPVPLPLEAVDEPQTLRREILSHLPAARTEVGVRALLNQEVAWNELRHRAHQGEPIGRLLQSILQDRTLQHLLQPPTVAIVGAANVGKSTLANQLFAQERSITADVPGTTRDWVGEIANIDGLPVMLVDTPGVRITDDAIERTAIERSRAPVEQAGLVLLVLDVTRGLEDGQAELLQQYPNAIRVMNKSDQHSTLGAIEGVPTVATTGQGIDEIRRRIVRFFCSEAPIDLARPRWWTERQRSILERSLTDFSILDEL